METLIRDSIDKYYPTWFDPLSSLELPQRERIKDVKNLAKIVAKVKRDISMNIITDVHNSGILFKIKSIFSLDDDLVTKFYRICITNPNHNTIIEYKACICLFLTAFIIGEERKYVERKTFFVNMTITDDFDTSMKFFRYSDHSADESFLKIASRNFLIIPTPGQLKLPNYPREYTDVLLYLLDKIVDVIYTKFGNTIKLDPSSTKTIFTELSNMANRQGFYCKIIEFIEFIKETEVIGSFCISHKDCFAGSFDTQVNTIFNITTFVSLMKPDLDVIKRFGEIVESEDYENNASFLTLAQISELGENKDPLTECYMNVDDKKLFRVIFSYRYKHYHQGDDITDSIMCLYDFFSRLKGCVDANEVTVDLFMTKDILDYDELILKLKLIKKITGKSGCITEEIINDSLRAFTCIEERDGTFYMYHSDRDRAFNNGVYSNDTADNDLYTRIAKTILYSNFLRVYPSKLLSLGVSRTVLDSETVNQLKIQNVKIYNNLTIDVHDEDRDNQTRKAIIDLLDLNENDYNFEDTEDSENAEEDELSRWTGRLSRQQIGEYVEEFFEYARVNFNYDNSQLFFRVMGYNYLNEKHEREDGDFSGFLDETHNLGITYKSGRVIIAYLWEYACTNSLQREMLSVIKKCIQYNDYTVNGKTITKSYSVCNAGKLQRFVITLLQGRYRLKTGELVLVDNIDMMKKKIDYHTDVNRFNRVQINPVEAYNKVSGFIKANTMKQPRNANHFFKLLFEYIFQNKLEDYMYEIIETLSVYCENKNGYTINPDFSVASSYDRMFNTEDYLLLVEHVTLNEQTMRIQRFNGQRADAYDDENEDAFAFAFEDEQGEDGGLDEQGEDEQGEDGGLEGVFTKRRDDTLDPFEEMDIHALTNNGIQKVFVDRNIHVNINDDSDFEYTDDI